MIRRIDKVNLGTLTKTFTKDNGNDKATGKGTHSHTNGVCYNGNWIDDKHHGDGGETWPDGALYQ